MFETDSNSKKESGRRKFLVGAGAAVAGLAWLRFGRPSAADAAAANTPKMVKIADFSNAGVQTGEETVPQVVKTEAEWKAQLPHDSFEVTRHADTEMAFSGPLLNEHNKGVFRCICCDTALFNSDTKFESGTGWPSFYQPIAKENVHEIYDSSFGMERTAVNCARCEAHLGHVFPDGPKPTGLRYCMNSVSLKFAKA